MVIVFCVHHENPFPTPTSVSHSHCCRRNKPGDKDHGLSVMEEQLKHQENHVPDFLCLCRIYKDKFVESDYTDNECRGKAIHW